MTFIRPQTIRTRGSWSVEGAGTALQMLSDGQDNTGVLLDPANVGDGVVARLEPLDVVEAGDFTLSIRGRRFGAPMSVEYGIAHGEPGDGALEVFTREEVAIPNSVSTLTRVWDETWQARLVDMENVWFGIRVTGSGASSRLAIAEISLEVGTERALDWNPDLGAAPEGVLVWCRMGDGRVRQGKSIGGEWHTASDQPLELNSCNFAPNASGHKAAARWVTGWAAI